MSHKEVHLNFPAVSFGYDRLRPAGVRQLGPLGENINIELTEYTTDVRYFNARLARRLKYFSLFFSFSSIFGSSPMSVHRSSRPPTGAEGGPVIQQQPQTTTISHANCRKVFIQRDYSEGSGVRFSTRFPVELQDKIEQEHFEYTVKMMNNMYAEAEKANCSTFCEGCMACLTAYVIYFCSETHYEKCLKKVARFVVEQNEQGI